MEDGKITKIALLIVTMLIITITSVISTGVMYKMLIEERNNNKLNSIVYEESSIGYNIEGVYSFSESESEKMSYEFLDGKVKFQGLYMTEGTYEIIDDIITITYETSYDPEGNETDIFPNGKEEELTIIDDYTLECTREVDGEVLVSEYIKDEDIDKNVEDKSTVKDEKELLGKWEYNSIHENGEEISFRDVFGSSVQYGLGSLTFYEDGTFENYLPGATSSELEDKGKFSFDGTTIKLIYTNKTEELIYNSETESIEQTYGNYLLTLVRDDTNK